jgi:uncharacterized protein YbjT (DUF2867 family)
MMAITHETILVAGATGQQGGAVARHLREAGYAVRALTRDPESDKARNLQADGVDVVRGDLTDRDSLDLALRGVAGVFSVGTPFEQGPEAEVAQGKTLGDAAAAAGVKHFVYSSVGGANRDSGVPHFESKWEIEKHLHNLGLPLTIMRPVFFYENFGGFAMQPQGDGFTIAMALSPETTLQAVAVDDIGGFVALAFARPDDWIGREIELAGDDKTVPGYAESIAHALGTKVTYVQVPWEALREQSDDFYRMQLFFEREGYDADTDDLRRLYPELKTFDTWLAEGGLRRLREAA